MASIRGSVDRIGKSGLPTAPYGPAIDAIASRETQVEAILTPDPIGAISQASQAADQAKLLQQRLDKIREIHEHTRTLDEGLSAVRDQAAKHRQEGLRLDEQGGNPDLPLDQAAQLAEPLRQALNEGDPQAASAHLAAAQAALDQARQAVEGVLKARDFCDIQQPERMRETQRFAMPWRSTRRSRPSLCATSPGVLAKRGRQPGAGESAAPDIRPQAQEAASAASSTDQKYLLAARLLTQLGQEQFAVLRLMTALGDQLSGLRAVREECRKLAHELDDQTAAAAAYSSAASGAGRSGSREPGGGPRIAATSRRTA